MPRPLQALHQIPHPYHTASRLPHLILLQLHVLLLNPVLRDDKHLQSVADLDLTLGRTGERIRHELLDRLPRKRLGGLGDLLQTWTRRGIVLVLEVDLVVEERGDERASGAGGAAGLALVGADGVVGVQGADAVLVQPAEDGVDVVGEEALVVEDVAEALGAGVHAHLLVVLELVHLDDGVEALLERVAVGREADDGQHDARALVGAASAADLEEFGRVARVDVVAAGAAGVACQDGEVGSCDAESGATVVCVAGVRVSEVVLGRTASRLDVRVEAMLSRAACY